MSPLPNDVQTDESNESRPSQPQIPSGAVPNRPVFRPPFPPTPRFRPLTFWQIFLKDVASTVVGVSLLCGFLLFGFLVTIGVIANALNGESNVSSVEETVISGPDDASNKIVVLPLEGLITTDETGFFVEAIDSIREDKAVSGVVLRVNSPGGTIAGSDYYLHLLKKLKKDLDIPIVVSMGDLAASGGYYISTVGDKIFAERSTTTGSIGVIVSMYNASELCKKIGVRSNAVTSGPLKGMGDFMKEPSPEETAVWQKTVDEAYEQFLSVIREGRPWYGGQDVAQDEAAPKVEKIAGVSVTTAVEEQPEAKAEETPEASEVAENEAVDGETGDATATPQDAPEEKAEEPQVAQEAAPAESDDRDAQLRKIADGRIYSASEAKELHLIDEIGFLDDAINETIKLADVDEDDVQVVRYSETTGLFDALTGVKSNAKPLGKALETFSVPRGYYMCPRALPLSAE